MADHQRHQRMMANNILCAILHTTAFFLLLVSIVGYSNVSAIEVKSLRNVMVSEVMAEAGTNMSIGCPGITRNTFVVHLEWRCRGQCGGMGGTVYGGGSNGDNEVKLLKYVKDQTTAILKSKNRLRLEPEMFALEFDPISSEDKGQYLCLINNRPIPDAVIKLMVLDVPNPPGRPMVTGFTSRSMTLSWSKPRQANAAPILGYVITTGWRNVKDDDESQFRYLEQEVYTNSSRSTKHTVTQLQPFVVYSFSIAAINHVGRSRPSRNSYPAITLRERPSGKPRVTAAHNTSSTSIFISWQPPDFTTIHGEFEGYKISYRPRDVAQAKAIEMPIENPKAKSYTLTGLKTYTQYLVSLKVFNPEGTGPETVVVVMTDEGAPSSPRNVQLLSVTDTSIKISWWEPARANGVLLGYRVYFLHRNFTSVQTIRDNKSAMVETLTRLKPYSTYKIWIKAYTLKNEGKSSEPLIVTTDVRAPGRPNVANLSCQNANTMFLKWQRPTLYYRTVDVYHVFYKKEKDPEWNEQVVETVNNTINHMMYLNNLTTNTIYEIKIQAGTKSVVGKRIMHFGEFSKPRRILLQPGCEAMSKFSPRSTSGGSLMDGGNSIFLVDLEEHIGVIAGVVCGTLGLLLAIFAFLLWRRYTQDSNSSYYHEKYYSNHHDPTPELPGWDNNTVGDDGEHAIPVHLFPKHASELHMDQDVGFSKEYEELRADSCLEEYTAQDSQHPDNKELNRYPNIVAYDHTRVRLRGISNKSHLLNNGNQNTISKKAIDSNNSNTGSLTDGYINANFIDGFRKPRAYVGTQGPMQGSFPEFWRMIWEQNTTVIVMITHLFEGGKPKCDLYWPDAGSETYGEFVVSLLREDVLASYTLRTFSLRLMKTSNGNTNGGTMNGGTLAKKDLAATLERTIYQYHFTAWPDHGVPLHALPLISFIRNSAAAANTSSDLESNVGPIVVHCSAGVGRTGCYVVIDAMLRQIEARGDINIFSFLKHVRRQRNHCVQTEEQYIFIHDAVVEAIEAGETHINKTCLSRYIHGLQCIDVTDEKNHPPKVLEKQHKLVTTYHPGKSQYSTALRVTNQPKNRSPDYLSSDSSRVFLSPIVDVEGEDYINASWISGFFDRREFIITQHPMENTMFAFWQMVWEQEVFLVVTLSSIDTQECLPFWPSSGQVGETLSWENPTKTHQIRVVMIEELDAPSRRAIRVSLEVTSTAMQGLQQQQSMNGNGASAAITETRDVMIFVTPNWPHQCSPLSTVFDLIKVTDEEHHGLRGPIVAVDRYGGTQAASFCCLMTLWHQLHFEGGVDVYQLAKLTHYNRPGVLKSQEDYLFLYCALEAYVTNNGTTIPSPVDIEQFKSGYQLNGCVRVSRVYTDAALGERVSKVFSEVQSMNDSMRVPPDGQESAALLRNAENNGQCGGGTLVSFSCANNGVYADTLTSRSSNGGSSSTYGTLSGRTS